VSGDWPVPSLRLDPLEVRAARQVEAREGVAKAVRGEATPSLSVSFERPSRSLISRSATWISIPVCGPEAYGETWPRLIHMADLCRGWRTNVED
jgi:hypothetical protein